MVSIMVRIEAGKILFQNFEPLAQDVLETNGLENFQPGLTDLSKSFTDKRKNGLVIISAKDDEFIPENRPAVSLRECQVLQYMSNGLTPEQTGAKMGITYRTVRKHLDNLKRKFNTDSRDQLMARAAYWKICDPYDHEFSSDGLHQYEQPSTFDS
jgi:DNA-binding CsgD family transcriptional regulator